MFGIGSFYETQAYESAESEYFDGECSGPRYYPPVRKTCKHCGQGGFTWKMHAGNWRMADASGKIHACLTEKAAAAKKANAAKKSDDLVFVKKQSSPYRPDEQTIDDFVDGLLQEMELELMQEHNH
jgi:hypothetical protein